MLLSAISASFLNFFSGCLCLPEHKPTISRDTLLSAGGSSSTMEGLNAMKRLLLGAMLFSCSASLMAAESLCQQKEQDIQHEIAMAKQHDNQRRVNGLERALTEVRANCSDKQLKSAHAERLESQKKKVAERERELQKARADKDDQDKIEKRERKLNEARQTLKKLAAEPY